MNNVQVVRALQVPHGSEPQQSHAVSSQASATITNALPVMPSGHVPPAAAPSDAMQPEINEVDQNSSTQVALDGVPPEAFVVSQDSSVRSSSNAASERNDSGAAPCAFMHESRTASIETSLPAAEPHGLQAPGPHKKLDGVVHGLSQGGGLLESVRSSFHADTAQQETSARAAAAGVSQERTQTLCNVGEALKPAGGAITAAEAHRPDQEAAALDWQGGALEPVASLVTEPHRALSSPEANEQAGEIRQPGVGLLQEALANPRAPQQRQGHSSRQPAGAGLLLETLVNPGTAHPRQGHPSRQPAGAGLFQEALSSPGPGEHIPAKCPGTELLPVGITTYTGVRCPRPVDAAPMPWYLDCVTADLHLC